MPSTVSVAIQVVGLAVFSSQVPNDYGLKIILPRVVSSNPWTQAATLPVSRPGGDSSAARTAVAAPLPIQAVAPTTTATPPPQPRTAGAQPARRGPGLSSSFASPHVEDHIALLVFPASEYITNTNWSTPITLPGDPSYKYVMLNGERIQFGTGIPNQAPSLTDPKLPSLQALCPSMKSLNADFKPPYPGAAAVFDVPQGSVNACTIPNKRIDTEINLQSNGILTISSSAARVRKEIQLKPDQSGTIKLIVANVPVSCLTKGYCTAPSPGAIDSVSHVHAYYAMGDCRMAAANTISITAWANSTDQLPSNHCTAYIPNAVGGFGMTGPKSPPHVLATDFECSNTRWP